MIFGIVAAGCFAAAITLLLRLHFLPTGLDPVSDAVSDYGTTGFHRLYRAMVVLLGLGAVVLAIGLARDTDAGNLFWLWVYGASRIGIAGFMIDRDPPPLTTEGRVHLVLAAAAFTAIAFAASNIDWSGAPGALREIGYAVAATAVATLLSRLVDPLQRVFGLVERLLYVTSLVWLMLACADLISGA